MNNPFDYIPDKECDEAFETLLHRLDVIRQTGDAASLNFVSELEEGKMLGVLIASDDSGVRHTLYAFSGQVGCGGFHFPGFVGPVFDYLQPGSYFKIHESEISQMNRMIADFEVSVLQKVKAELESAKSLADEQIIQYKEKCRRSKAERDARRQSACDDKAVAAMLRQSRFEKAELHRLKKRLSSELQPFHDRLGAADAQLADMKEKRRKESESLQHWLFSNFKLLNANGLTKSLEEIFAQTALKVPPSGAGECCAPKLLHAAFMRGWRPVAMAEYWYGRPKRGEVRIQRQHYPACRGKCLPVLRWMMQGLDVQPPLGFEFRTAVIKEPKILFENEWFCVVDKPGGMLSVPGKGSTVSVESWLKKRYGEARNVKVAHRLDQDTSGLLIATFGPEAYRQMQALFATRKVHKTYVADLTGDYGRLHLPQRGRIELPLSPDWLDRPRQRVDFEEGKEAVTDYEFERVTDGNSRIILHPHTGRTHQLRVHAASAMGLRMPIVGDRLYGISHDSVTVRTAQCNSAQQRLHLHSSKIEFTFPLDSRRYSFTSPVPF